MDTQTRQEIIEIPYAELSKQFSKVDIFRVLKKYLYGAGPSLEEIGKLAQRLHADGVQTIDNFSAYGFKVRLERGIDVVDFISDFEAGGVLTVGEVVEGFIELANRGILFHLQGFYHRTFQTLLDADYIKKAGDEYVNNYFGD